jgi:hypothetical protein
MRRGVAEILTAISNLKTKNERISALKTWDDNAVLKNILFVAFDPRVKWLLPEGTPPYKKNALHDQEGVLYSEARKLYLFLEGGNPNLKQIRREQLFIEFLEMIAPADAEMILYAKDKKLPWKQITPEIVMEAFPGLIENVNPKEE